MNDQAPAHSPIGASSYKRWKNCPGSVRLAKTIENFSSDFADEGTEAHDLACAILTARAKGKPEPDLFGIDDDMIEHVLLYVDHMIELQEPGCIQLYEHRFHLKKVHPLCFGTADGVTYFPSKKLLVISDLKYGAGVYVDVERNDQLLYYATGAVLSLGLPVRHVRIEIIQPRITYAEAIRPWTCDIFDIWDFADELRNNAEATEDPNAPLCAGEWCQFCPVSAGCPLLKAKAKALVACETAKPTPEALADDLAWLPLLEGMIKRKREYAYKIAELGEKIPGWKLTPKRGHRVYADEEEAGAEMLFAGFDQTQMHTVPKLPTLLSPAQIEALPLTATPFKTKKELKAFVTSLTTTISSGHKLVLETEPGEEVKPVTAKSVFSARRKEIAELT